MAKSPIRALRRRQVKVAGFIFFLVMLAGGLLLGTQSTLTLHRDSNGSVHAMNAWRFAGRVTLLSHSVAGLRDVKFERMNLSENERRSSAYRDAFGRSSVPEQVVLVGDGQFAYPYADDVGLIRAFLGNPGNRELILSHPVDIRREAASWFLLALSVLCVVGWLWKLAAGSDPLSGMERSVKPLPPAIGAAVFIGGILLLVWFFMAGHHVFGPVATRKVRLLMDSTRQDNAAGIATAASEGVFLDFRDDQGMTALMLAVRAGAAHAVDALLKAGANPNLRNMDDDTALMMALQTNHAALAPRLLEAGTDLSATDSNGRTVLHAAAESGDAVTLRLLLKAGSNVNELDSHGWTPLIFAAAHGNGDAVRVLLDAGADVRTKLPDGRTAADFGSFEGDLGDRLRKSAQ